jgi:hypothetical protein
MDSMLLEVIIILALILINGLFAMAEIAVVSARKARLQQAADEGDGRAKTALELASHPLGFLATAQIGISLAGILAGVYGGATIAERPNVPDDNPAPTGPSASRGSADHHHLSPVGRLPPQVPQTPNGSQRAWRGRCAPCRPPDPRAVSQRLNLRVAWVHSVDQQR